VLTERKVAYRIAVVHKTPKIPHKSPKIHSFPRAFLRDRPPTLLGKIGSTKDGAA